MTLLEYDYYGFSIWLSICTYFVGKGLCGIVHRDLYIRTIRGENTNRKGKSAMYFGLLFVIVFLLASILTFRTLIGLFGFFNIYVFSSVVLAINTFSLGYQPREVRNKLKLKNIGHVLLGVAIAFVFLLRINEFFGIADIWKREVIIKDEIVQNKGSYEILFLQTFSQIEQCVETKKQSNWNESCSLLASNSMAKLSLPNRTNVYYVKLCRNNTLCKVFKSGHYKRTRIETLGEERVKKLLLGKQVSLTDNFRINEGFSNIKYLFDLYSEAEIILPFVVNGKVAGAVVEVYGD